MVSPCYKHILCEDSIDRCNDLKNETKKTASFKVNIKLSKISYSESSTGCILLSGLTANIACALCVDILCLRTKKAHTHSKESVPQYPVSTGAGLFCKQNLSWRVPHYYLHLCSTEFASRSITKTQQLVVCACVSKLTMNEPSRNRKREEF